MLMMTGVSLVGAAYLVLRFTQFICRVRPASIWASEAAVLVVLTPTVMILLASGVACLAKFWFDGGLRNIDRFEAALMAALVVSIVVIERLTRLRQRAARKTPA